MNTIGYTPATIQPRLLQNASPLQAQKITAQPQFAGNKLFGTEDKFGKKHWSINLTGLPLIDRAFAYVAVPFVAALGIPTAHGFTPGGHQLNSLTTAYRQVAQVDNDQSLSPELTTSMQQEKFRSFITEFNGQLAADGNVGASALLGQFPTFTPEDIQATQQIINNIPEKGSIQDVRDSIQDFKTDVLAKHFSTEEIARFDEVATRHLDGLKLHEYVNTSSVLVAIIAVGIAVGLFGLGFLAVASALKKR